MRDESELIELKYFQLTAEEKELINDSDYNCCDICEDIEFSESLIWVDSETFWDKEFEDARKEKENFVAKRICKQGHSAVCHNCFDREMILEQSILAMRDTLNHFNKHGMAKFNGVGGNTSTYGFLLERAIRDYEEEYKIDILSSKANEY
jgi:hypothetical protein